MIVVKVILPIPIRKLFKYVLPGSIVPIIGSRIIVPFRSQEIIGIIFSFNSFVNIHKLNLKYVKSIIDCHSIYTNTLFDLLLWFTNYYYCPIGTIFFTVLPTFLRTDDVFKRKKSITLNVVKKQLIVDMKTFYNKKKQVKTFLSFQKKKIFLTKQIIFSINEILKRKKFSSWLLTSVNLYQKVKFYLGLIKKILDQGLQVLILVPHFRYINRIKLLLNKYFTVSIKTIHEQVTDFKSTALWMNIKNGTIKLVIGTKMSIFFPFLNLGLIIVNEENSLFYNHFISCKFNVRDVSILRAFKENIPIILDSETPSLKTLYNIYMKKCFSITLSSYKYNSGIKNYIINLKYQKIISGLSSSLIIEIHKNIQKKKQVLLIFNKFNSIFLGLICNNCGWTAKCNICQDYYEYNKYSNTLTCQSCLIKIKRPLFCSSCGFLSLMIRNLGMKKIQNTIKNIFLKIPVFFLLSAKSIKNFNTEKKFFELFYSQPCIIVSIEKIVHNYFFPNLGLIALISIDYYFFSFDFRSIEKFAQFYFSLGQITKNSTKSLTILIQTLFPNNLNLIKLCKIGYNEFVYNILKDRKINILPPFIFQVVIYTKGVSAKKNYTFLYYFCNILKKISQEDSVSIICFGPYPCFLLTNKKYFYYKLSVQCSSRKYLNYLLKKSIKVINFFSISRNITWFLDVEFN